MKVFSGSSNRRLAEKVVKQLGIDLSSLDTNIFPDGERRIRVIDKVVGQDTVVIQSTSPQPDTAYMELFFIIDALKRSGAKSITAIIPYLGYQRQDHVFRDGEAVSLEVIIETLEKVGMTKLLTFDLHSIKIPELFSVPVVHLSALSIFARKIKQ
ncbi:MAG: ribose-phosphate diphosphokinase, partial [Patescibacteria group bacterium]|nr:ribose-phosphate diphosphokinase [Patescibacteria group bacterium]